MGRVALVTGASAGIGAAISETLVNQGMTVIGCSRNVEQIQRLGSRLKDTNNGGRLVAYPCDVSKEDDVTTMFRQIRDQHGPVSLCVNNAGVAHAASLLEGSTSQWREMLEINVLGPTLCSREAFRSMREAGVDDGHIVNINSGSGHYVSGRAETNFYCATKFALTALTEGVRTELREHKSNVRVSQISPGMVKTEFRKRMHNLTDHETDVFYQDRVHLDVKDVVDALLYLLTAPSHMQVHDVIVTANPRPETSAAKTEMDIHAI